MILRRVSLIPVLLLAACSTAPKRAEDSVTAAEARVWLGRHCSRGPREVSGSLVFQANTPDFKGRWPGSVRVRADGSFTLEATHILGGTIVQIQSDGKTCDLKVPSRPRAERTGLTEYLGMGVPILRSLLQGELPCPSDFSSAKIRAEGAVFVLESAMGAWTFLRAVEQDDRVPFGIDVVPVGDGPGKSKIELRIDSWDLGQGYAKKVRVHTAEGDLKWSWRSREAPDFAR